MISGIKSSLDQGDRYDLLDNVLEEVGYNRDVEISEEVFRECNQLKISNRTYVDKLYPGAKVYRDDKPTTSLHLTDFRESDKEGIGAHIEYFNPEYHPFLHMIDVILWHLKNFLEEEERDIRIK